MTLIQCLMENDYQRHTYGYLLATSQVQWHVDEHYYAELIDRELYRQMILAIWKYDINEVF